MAELPHDDPVHHCRFLLSGDCLPNAGRTQCLVAAGVTVPLEGDIYMRHGGMQQDRTAEVHPEIAALAIDTATIVGLDIAGLDLIAEDITRAPDGQSLAILEVNPEPAIILHMAKFSTPARPVAQAIVESLFPCDQTGRVPIIAVLGESCDLDQARRVATEWRRRHAVVGLATREGVWLNGRQLGPPRGSVGQHARRLMRHPHTDAVVIHLTLSDILVEGLPFDRCDELIELRPAAPADSDARRALECVRKSRQTATGA